MELLKNITKEYMDVQIEPVNIINHWHKSVIFQNKNIWHQTQKILNYLSPKTAPRCRFLRTNRPVIIRQVNMIIHINHHGLYRDDGSIIELNKGRQNDRIEGNYLGFTRSFVST